MIYDREINDVTILATFKTSCEETYKGQRYTNYKNYICTRITDIVLSLDFKDNTRYKIDVYEKTGKVGVLNRYNENLEWTWSWMNAINTHYSSIYRIFIWMNNKLGTKFTHGSFRMDKISETYTTFFDLLEQHKDTILTPGSSIFRELFFMAQFTWIKGLMSNIDTKKYLSKYYDFQDDSMCFERGEVEDFNGADYVLINEKGEELICQHKNTNLFTINDEYRSYNLDYVENKYREGVDIITVDDGSYLYLFQNSKNRNLIGNKPPNKIFFAKESQLIKRIQKDVDELFPKIMLITKKCCYQNHIAMVITKDENKEGNSYTLENKLLIITINDEKSPELGDMLDEILEQL